MDIDIDVDYDPEEDRRKIGMALAGVALIGIVLSVGVFFGLPMLDSGKSGPQKLGPGYTDHSINNSTELVRAHGSQVGNYNSYQVQISVRISRSQGETQEETRVFRFQQKGNFEVAAGIVERGPLRQERFFDKRRGRLYVQQTIDNNTTYRSDILRRPNLRYSGQRFILQRIGILNTTYEGETTFNGASVYKYEVTGVNNTQQSGRNISVSGNILIGKDDTIRRMNITASTANQTSVQVYELTGLNSTTVSQPPWLGEAINQTSNRNGTSPQLRAPP